MEKIKCMVVDDLESIREHFCTLVSECADMTLVCEAESGREAIERAKSAKPDIILMDIQLEDESAGIRATERIKEIMPDAKVIILTVHNNDKFMMDAYLAGASDYILKYDDGANILSTIRMVYKNDFFLGPLLAKKLKESLTLARNREESLLFFINNYSRITDAEKRITKHLYAGKKRREIAEAEFVSMETVKTHISHILKKLGFHSAAELTAFLKKIKIFDEFDV